MGVLKISYSKKREKANELNKMIDWLAVIFIFKHAKNFIIGPDINPFEYAKGLSQYGISVCLKPIMVNRKLTGYNIIPK